MTHAIPKKLAMTAWDNPHPMSPGMPTAGAHEVRAEFDHLVIHDDFVTDLAGNTSHRFLEFQPQLTINTNGQLELHLTVPGPDVWTSLLTAMAVIRQSGYAPIAVHVLDKSRADNHPVQALRQRLKPGKVRQAKAKRHGGRGHKTTGKRSGGG